MTKTVNKVGVAILFWMACATFSTGAFNADFRGNYPQNYHSARYAKHECGTAAAYGVATGPIGAVLIVFLTGFLDNGWTLSCAPLAEPA